MKREETRSIKVGNLTIGGNNDVIIQSMTNTKTHDVEATVKQIQDLTAAGCQLVRLAVLDQRDALAIKDIKNRVNVPLVADIHFDYRLALQAIESGIDKIRINPGNIGSIDKVKQVVTACKEHHIPIRIGNTIRVSLSDSPVEEIKVAKTLLKELGLIKNVPTLVSCPTCGRIQYDLIPVAKEIEDFLNTINADITVAIMGCAVNGPGEAKHADIGIAGGVNEGLLIKKGEIIRKVKQSDMVEELKKEILLMIK